MKNHRATEVPSWLKKLAKILNEKERYRASQELTSELSPPSSMTVEEFFRPLDEMKLPLWDSEQTLGRWQMVLENSLSGMELRKLPAEDVPFFLYVAWLYLASTNLKTPCPDYSPFVRAMLSRRDINKGEFSNIVNGVLLEGRVKNS